MLYMAPMVHYYAAMRQSRVVHGVVTVYGMGGKPVLNTRCGRTLQGWKQRLTTDDAALITCTLCRKRAVNLRHGATVGNGPTSRDASARTQNTEPKEMSPWLPNKSS
jgi:hypothetical protein